MQTLDAAEGPVRSRRRVTLGHLVFWIAAASVVAIDQATKAIVRGTMNVGDAWPEDWPVNIRYVTNTVAAFGSLQNATTFLIAMSLIGLAAI